MLFKPFFLFMAAATASPIIPRSATSTIMNDITALDNAVKSLTSSLNSFNGGLFGMIEMAPITLAFTAVHTSNRLAYSDAQKIKTVFSAADSASIVALVQKTLVIDNPIAVKITEQKKAAFGILDSMILSALQTLLSDHLSLSAVLVANVDPSQLSVANAAVAIITKSLQDGVAYYS